MTGFQAYAQKHHMCRIISKKKTENVVHTRFLLTLCVGCKASFCLEVGEVLPNICLSRTLFDHVGWYKSLETEVGVFKC